MATQLSQYIMKGWAVGMWRSRSNECNQTISQTVESIALYSASADDLETTVCFLDFHEMRLSPRKIQNLDVDLLVSKQDAQSESAKDLI